MVGVGRWNAVGEGSETGLTGLRSLFLTADQGLRPWLCEIGLTGLEGRQMRAVGRELSGSDIFVVIGRNALACGCGRGLCLVMVGWGWGRDRTACAVPLLLGGQ